MVEGRGGGWGCGGADVCCCQPTRSLPSCSQAEVEVMMLPPAPSLHSPSNHHPPPLPPSSGGGDYYDVDVVDPLSELFFSLCVPSAKSGRVLPSSLFHPTHMHTHFFSFLFKAALICAIQTKPPLGQITPPHNFQPAVLFLSKCF